MRALVDQRAQKKRWEELRTALDTEAIAHLCDTLRAALHVCLCSPIKQLINNLLHQQRLNQPHRGNGGSDRQQRAKRSRRQRHLRHVQCR